MSNIDKSIDIMRALQKILAIAKKAKARAAREAKGTDAARKEGK